jgi:hypothetical protein
MMGSLCFPRRWGDSGEDLSAASNEFPTSCKGCSSAQPQNGVVPINALYAFKRAPSSYKKYRYQVHYSIFSISSTHLRIDNISQNKTREKGRSQIMTTTKLDATAPPFSSCPPPDPQEDRSSMPAVLQVQNASVAGADDQDGASNIIESQNTLAESPVERETPANSNIKPINILAIDPNHELHYKTQSAMRFVI